MLDLHLISDTGRDRSQSDHAPRQFKLAEDCESKLFLYIFVNKVDQTNLTNWLWNIWKPTTYPDLGKDQEHEHVPGVHIYGYGFNLTELFDRDAIINCVNQFKQNVKAALGFDVDTCTFG